MWSEYFHIVTDPAHGLAEITYTILFDFVIVGLVWGVIFNRFILPRVKRDIHAEIDSSHGYSHTEAQGLMEPQPDPDDSVLILKGG
jgi:hypothetical protein